MIIKGICKKCKTSMTNHSNYWNDLGYRVMRFKCLNPDCGSIKSIKVIEGKTIIDRARTHDRIKKLFGGQQ